MKGWTPGVRRVWLLRSVALIGLLCSLPFASTQAQAAGHASKLKLSASLPKQLNFGTSETIKAKVGGSASTLRGTHLELQSLTGKKVKAVAKASLRGPGKAKLTLKPKGTGLQTLRVALLRGRKLLAKTKPKDVFIAHDTEAIDPSKIISAPPAGEAGQIVYSGDPKLSAGDFVATGVGEATPSGMLGLVSSSKTSGDKTVVSTTPADLIDALPKGSIDVDQDIPEQTITIGDEEVADSEGRIARGTFNCGTGAKLQISGSVSLTPRVSFTADWGFLKVSSARFESGVTVTSNLTVKAIGSASCSISRKQLGQLYLKPIDIQVGYVPVILVPRVALYLSGDGTVSADVTTGVTGSISGSAGISYANGRYSPIGGLQPSFSYSPPQVTNRAHLGASTSPELDLLLYGVAGPSVFVQGGLDFTATLGADPWWTLDAPVSAGARLVVPSIGLKSGDLNVYKRSFRLAQASGPRPEDPDPAPPDPDPDPDDPIDPPDPETPSQDGQLSAGWSASCGVQSTAAVICWYTASGTSWVPDGQFTAVSTGYYDACGIKLDETLQCWRIGGLTPHDLTPPEGSFRTVSTGGYFACGIRTDDTAVCWGSNQFGQLLVPSGTYKSISASLQYACGVKTDGSAVCWGNGNYYPLTDKFRSVSAAANHACGIRTDGTVLCWGYDGNGEREAPDGEFKSVVTGYDFSCGLRTNGSVECWGKNRFGDSWPPPGNFQAISAHGGYHICGIRTGGAVECWGSAQPPSGAF